jgi:hypothetical protein
MTNWTRDEVLNKVALLLRLAAGTPEEAEAQTAMNKAHELLKQYDLSMSDVELEKEVETITTDGTETFHFAYAWIWSIAWSISQLTNTKYFRQRNFSAGKKMADSNIRFVGTKTDVAVATALFTYMRNTIKILASASPYSKPSERTSYCNGVAQRIKERVKEIKQWEEEQKDAAGARCTAIVHVKDGAIKKYMQENFRLRNENQNFAGSLNRPFAHGMQDGNNVPLNIHKALPGG